MADITNGETRKTEQAKNQQSLEEILNKLTKVYETNKLSEVYDKISTGRLKERVGPVLEQIGLNIQNDHNFYLNRTEAANQYAFDYYKNVARNQFSPEIDKIKSNILDNYVNFFNDQINESQKEITKELEKNPQLAKLKADEKKKIIEQEIEPRIYGGLANVFLELKLNKDYNKDENLVRTYNQLSKFKDVDENEIQKYGLEIAMSNPYTDDNTRNVHYDWSSYFNRQKQMLSQSLGQTLISKDKEGNYKINKEKLSEAFSNYESYLSMSPYALDNIKKEKTKGQKKK